MFDIVRPRLAHRPLTHEATDVPRLRRGRLWGKLILARRGDEFLELQLQLLEQPCRALGSLPAQFAFELLNSQLKMRDNRRVVRQLRQRAGSVASARSRASRSACSAARALTRSDGRSSGFDIMKPLNQIMPQIQTKNGYPTRVGRRVS
ncbi:hypothetical protein ABIE89_000380 [Bradyrhizobium niftali]